MQFIDILSFCLSLLGINGLILYFRHLLPRNAIPPLSALMSETWQLLHRAEAIGAVPPQGECSARLGRLAEQFTTMRVESNHARGAFQQLRLTLFCNLTWRIYSLYYRIEAIKSELELAIDEQQLSITESVANTVVPNPAAETVTPADSHSVIEPTLPLPATAC